MLNESLNMLNESTINNDRNCNLYLMIVFVIYNI